MGKHEPFIGLGYRGLAYCGAFAAFVGWLATAIEMPKGNKFTNVDPDVVKIAAEYQTGIIPEAYLGEGKK